MKFGGSILSSPEDIDRICNIIKAEKEDKIIILSAMKGVTDKLGSILALTDKPYLPVISEIESDHIRIVETSINNKNIRFQVASDITEIIVEMKKEIEEIQGLEKVPPYMKDHFNTYGERLAIMILSGALNDRGAKASPFGSEDIGLYTEGDFGNATVDMVASKRSVVDELGPVIKRGEIPVITGFYGCNIIGSTVCFGRNGSDYSSAAIANLIEADCLEIWKDVPGIMSADPRLIRSARRIERLSYDEAAELSYFGALVIHPRTVEPLRQKKIPLMIKDIYDPELFTLVEHGSLEGSRDVRSVSFTENIGILKLKGICIGSKPGVLSEVTSVIDSSCINLRSVITSQGCIMLVLDRIDLTRCAELIGSKHIAGIDKIEQNFSLSLIGVVGEGIFENHGVASEILQTVSRKGINIEMISAGPSNAAYFFIVDEKDLSCAVGAIHDDYILEVVNMIQKEHEKRIKTRS